jgi:hypothetical protein
MAKLIHVKAEYSFLLLPMKVDLRGSALSRCITTAHCRLIVVTALSWASIVVASDLRGDDSASRRFRAEAPKAWEQYVDQLLQGNKAVVRAKMYDLVDGGKVTHESTSEVLLAPPLYAYSVTSERNGEASARQASITNSRYGFTLRSESKATWELKGLTLKASRVAFMNATPLGDGSERDLALRTGLRCLSINTTYFPAMTKSERFQLRKATFVSVEEQQRVRVDFSYMPIQGNDIVREGAIWLDPKNHWLIEKASVKAQWSDATGRIELVNRYSSDALGVPVLARQVLQQRAGSDTERVAIDTEWDYVWEKISTGLNEADFTLSAYGLPEPGMKSETRLGTLLIVLNLLVLVCLVAAIALRRRCCPPSGGVRHGTGLRRQ